MSKRSKAYEAAAKLIEADKIYSPLEAAKMAIQAAPTKFDSTVEVAMRLGVDPRKADQMVRGTVSLPHGTGKTARVIVFATGEQAAAAEAAGADKVGSDDLIAEITDGFLDFDAAIATPDQMAKVGRIARILGPRGLMPNPKTGTVTPDVAKAVADIKGGKITFRVDKQSNLHLVIGKASFSAEQAGRELRCRAGRGAARQAVLGQGQVPEEGRLLHHDGPRHPGRHQPDPQPARGQRSSLIRQRRTPAVPGPARDGGRSASRAVAEPGLGEPGSGGAGQVNRSRAARPKALTERDRASRTSPPATGPARSGDSRRPVVARVIPEPGRRLRRRRPAVGVLPSSIMRGHARPPIRCRPGASPRKSAARARGVPLQSEAERTA